MLYAQLRSVARDPSPWTTSPPVDLLDISAELPTDVVALVNAVGDSPPMFGGRLPPLAELERFSGQLDQRAFPLTHSWLDPQQHDPGAPHRTGVGPQDVEHIYPLPPEARHDDGTIVLGVTSDHSLLRLVLHGPPAMLGTVWVDATGQDGGGMLVCTNTGAPSVSGQPARLLDLVLGWLETALREETAIAERHQQLHRDVRSVLEGTMPAEDFPQPARALYDWYAEHPPFDRDAMEAGALINAAQSSLTSKEAPFTGWFHGMAGAWDMMLSSSLAYWQDRAELQENRVHHGDTALTHARIAAVMLSRPVAVADTRYRPHSEYYSVRGGFRLAALVRELPVDVLPELAEQLGPELVLRVLVSGWAVRKRKPKHWQRTRAWLETVPSPSALVLRQLQRLEQRLASGEYMLEGSLYQPYVSRWTSLLRPLVEHDSDPSLAWLDHIRRSIVDSLDNVHAIASGERSAMTSDRPDLR